MENTMMDTGHVVGTASDNMAEVTQGIAAIVTYAQAARNFLDHRPPDLDEVRQALDRIVRDGYLASDVIYRIRGLLFKEAPPSANSVVA
jgi:hypothetical protein